MKAFYAERALRNLEDILTRLHSANPLAASALERRIVNAVARIENWPKSARAVTQWRGNVRVLPLVRFPYLIFYQIADDRIEILHIRHTARAPWTGPED
jgi:toxin ParE1/3/4